MATSPTAARQNVAAFRVTLDGRDLTDRIAPRLLSLSLTEKRGGEADELELVIHDHDGKLAIPAKGALIRLELGWARGADVAAGLIDKGRYKVDEAEASGPPDIVTVRARSADLTDGLRVRREAGHKAITLGALARKIAAGAGLEARVDASLAAVPVAAIEQHQRSDIALLRRIGRAHDAVATVKDGKLILSPIGKGTTATGKPLPALALARRDGDAWRYARTDRGQYAGVEARWHDQGAASRKTVKVGGGTGKAKRLPRVYHSEVDARAAASAEAARIGRAAASFDLTLALGRPDIFPDRPTTLAGWKPEIVARKWLVAEATHTMDAQGGLMTRVRLETA